MVDVNHPISTSHIKVMLFRSGKMGEWELWLWERSRFIGD